MTQTLEIPASARPSAQHIYRRMLGYVRAQRLKAGDLLPKQSQWRRQLRCGTTTFNKAMRRLERNGVVERRRRAGTRLLRTAPPEPTPWSIGLCTHMGSEQSSPYFAVLSKFLHLRLQHAGCRVYIYPGPRVSRPDHALSEFDGLEADLNKNRLDGLLVNTSVRIRDQMKLKEMGVIQCGVGGNDHGEPTAPQWPMVRMDLGPMIREAVRLLIRHGSRLPALIVTGGPWTQRQETYYRRVFQEITESMRMDGRVLKTWGSVVGGRQLGRQLLAMPPADRPDSLICASNDHVTLGITNELAGQSAYRPHIATHANRQSPLSFPYPVHRFEIDVREIAEKGVHALLHGLYHPDEPPVQTTLLPKLEGPEPSRVPTFLLNEDSRGKWDPLLQELIQ